MTACFWIDPVKPVVQYVACCSNKHRIVYEQHIGLDFSAAPDMHEYEWPPNCRECGVDLVFDRSWDEGWRTKMGTDVWRRADTGEEQVGYYGFGAGAMFDATEWTAGDWRGPDGRCLAVICPPGEHQDLWYIDSEARNGGHWERSGQPPFLVVTPSIQTSRYHGFLGSNGASPGHFTEDLEAGSR